MSKNLLCLILFVLAIVTASIQAEVTPVTSVVVNEVDNPGGAPNFWLESITVGGYTVTVDELVTGTSEGVATAQPAPYDDITVADNFDLNLFAGRADEVPPTWQIKELGGKPVWSDTNGDHPDFFLFETGGNQDFSIEAILPGGIIGSSVNVPQSTFGDTGLVITTSGPHNGQTIEGVAFAITDLLDQNGNNLTNSSIIEGIQISSPGLDPSGFYASIGGPVLTASNPSPADGALHVDTWVNLGWYPGDTAVSHDVYLGDNYDDVNAGAERTFQGNQVGTFFVAGFPGMPFPDGLAPGTTYYWRIDEVEADGTTKHKGNVWSFTIPSQIAYNPDPPDGAGFVDTEVTLNWTEGLNVKLNYIYFGDNFDDVKNATVGTPLGTTSYTPDTLELDKTYYWRVDEFDGATMHRGDIWSFTTLPDIPITDPNLVGWWKFEADSGTKAIDFSGHGNHGTIIDNVQWVPGQFNLALEFLGDDQGHVELPTGMVDTTKGSVTMWVNTDLTGNEGMFWYGTETDGDGFGDQLEIHIHNQDAGTLGFAIEGSTDVRLDGPLLAGAGWIHVAATWDLTDGCRLYANGEQVDFVGHNNTVANLNTIRLGRPVGTGNGNRYHDGLMDDVRLFDYAISAAQVSEIMAKGEDPLRAGSPNPRNSSLVSIELAIPLSWSAGENASEHDIYFGTDRDAVANADETDTTNVYRGRQGATSYNPPEGVEWGGGPYYWRIDEINTDGTISKGSLWSFTVADFIVIDDFESYNDIDEGEPGSNRIYNAWVDGYSDPTNGSQAGHLDPPFYEDTIVHGGNKSLPLYYDNAVGKSEVTLTLTDKRNWTVNGVTTLSIWFIG
ncbi:MAG: LamG domain-containing protein, partial [Thermoplasmata archaeon]